jgi:GT2 family glycosyltransferase
VYVLISPRAATIVISTKNRKDDLRSAVASCIIQVGEIEIFVVDDGSTDGTAEMLRAEFPAVRVISHLESTGYIVARNEAAKEANGAILFSIDDDAVFTSSDVVLKTLNDFSDPRVGAVAIPYTDVHRDGIERQRAPSANEVYITDRFIGTAYAVRKDLFLRLGGFRELFFHQGEESDFCIRMLDAGYSVRLGKSDRIDHFESPKRDMRRMDLYGRRNDILFAVLNVPLVFLIPHLIEITLKGLWFGIKVQRPVRMAQGLLFGYASALRYFLYRKPVSIATYRLFRQLRKNGAVEMSESRWHARRPPLATRHS